MSWIRVDINLPHHPKVGKLAKRLGIPRVQAVGVLVGLWSYAAQYHFEGDVTDQDWDDAAAFVGLTDAPLLTQSLMDSGWIEMRHKRVFWHDWEEYQGKDIARRLANRKRMQNVRSTDSAQTAHSAQNVQSDGRTDGRNERTNERTEGAKRGGNPTRIGDINPPYWKAFKREES